MATQATATAKSIKLTEEQVLYFRARRGHLAGPGESNPAAAARAILGAQAQQLPPALLAISQRTKNRPTADALTRKLHGSLRTLVRTWGQRDTLHLYDANEDWATVVAARADWAPGGRGGPMPPSDAVDRALEAFYDADRPLTRTDIIDIAPPRYLKAIRDRAKMAGMEAKRLAAARLIWKLSNDGHLCHADSIGNEQAYVTRAAWFPDMPWPITMPDPPHAAAQLARRYLSTYGPAAPKDLAHFFNARMPKVRGWLEQLEPELIEVECGGRKGLIALAKDERELKKKPPSANAASADDPARGWPLRLIPLWDSHLMAHFDKSWTVPDEADRKQIWRKAAYVAAVALHRGRAVATWTQKKTTRSLNLEVAPLSGWKKTKHLPHVKREAEAVAKHAGLSNATVKTV